MFTFTSISYNHSDYIIQHLESIKFQIESYGAGMKFDYVLCDDNSKDDTVELANRWLSNNQGLFRKVTVVKNNKNEGTVRNYLKAISLLETSEGKILASDDLYGTRNIFDVYRSDKIVLNFSYPFFLDDKEVKTFSVNSKYFDKAKLFMLINNSYFLKLFISNNGSLSGPATYYPTVYLQDEGLPKSMSKYKLVEDRPLWKHLFVKRKLAGQVVYNYNPLIYYRTSVGVTSSESPVHDLFKRDCDLLAKESGLIGKLPKLINPFNYVIKALIFYSKILSVTQEKLHVGRYYSLSRTIESERSIAIKHIEMLNSKALFFKCQK
ncbi:glycosyltransferase [Vibrio sp. K4]|uniref:glycosyltransferase n=1 Tax=Vibrio sp. K4 TaxID=3391579 RepID=UPI003DA761C9